MGRVPGPVVMGCRVTRSPVLRVRWRGLRVVGMGMGGLLVFGMGDSSIEGGISSICIWWCCVCVWCRLSDWEEVL